MLTSYVQRYKEQGQICVANTEIIEYFLKNFMGQHPELRLEPHFCMDLAIACGPNCATQTNSDLCNRWKNNEVALYNIKNADISFVTEYKKIPLDNGMVLIKPFEIPFRTYMICKNREYDIPLYVSVAVGKLFKAQAYRSAIYSAHMAEIDKAMSFIR